MKWHGSRPWGVRMDRLGNETEGETHSRMSGQACGMQVELYSMGARGGRRVGQSLGWGK